ncbi:hypothetical protein EDB92DRAFT_1852171 [Lactarius akahatsu]|uniref:Uncharacterized protein n=1 Tax=Lactarius akahatsu TaxID=416441 RepID=A0AAD4LK19_9AGAM|nr:hypothetical protein EDB92DRAFT_1852171 [Lactarius akahatsu]
MSFIASPRRSSPEPLPSLPPSPVEEDLGWRAPWSHSDDDDSPRPNTASSPSDFQHSKGKQKATEYQSPTSYANGGRGEVWPDQGRSTEAYPPTTDEATETRRVQENLKLWEVAERQRRKTARESASPTSSSLVVDVARRASALWSRRSSHHSVDGGGKHRALHTSEDHVRLDDIEASPLPSAAPSPCPSPGPSPNHRPVAGPGPYVRRADDPFSDPLPGSSSSLFVNAQSTPEIDTASPTVELQTPTSAAPLFSSPPVVSHSGNRLPANVVTAPAPLDLPKPRSPPPRTATPHAKRPPEPFPRPDSRMSRTTADEEEDDRKPVRWWTEWLCGCSEGPDRGGEVQAGRTNPME